MRSAYAFVLFVGVVGLNTPTLGQHADDLWLAVSAEGRLKLHPLGFHPGEEVTVLPPGGPWYPGWKGDEPGFDDIENPAPEYDCFPFEDGAVIELYVVSLDPALVVWYGFERIEPGEAQTLGSTPGDIHAHLDWHISTAEPGFDPLRVHWRGTFRLRDAGTTGYTDSEDFTLVFSYLSCCPGDANKDGVVNAFDIDPFVEVLLDPGAVPEEVRCAADVNLDGLVNAFDIDPFIDLLTNN